MIFSGKTLLELGTNAGSAEMVAYAKEQGAYTIVADYLPPEKSVAKQIADEHVLISTNDVEKLDRLLKERHVDAVLAGISEWNLLNAMKLSERNHLHFYCTRKQWAQVENKQNFRNLCVECNVPTPFTYFMGSKINQIAWDQLQYPLILKPVDNSASFGVHICYSERELRNSFSDAFQYSNSGNIIIEQYVEGKEFTAHYTIVAQKVYLACMDDRIPGAIHPGNVTTVPLGRVYPSLFLEEYLQSVDQKIKELCKKLALQDAVLFVQGIYHPQRGFFIFEGGLRPAAELPCRFLSKVNGVNFLNLLVEHTILGRAVTYQPEKENPRLNGRCCAVISIAAREGVVGAINGWKETIQELPSILSYENRCQVGQWMPNGDTLRQLAIRFVMVCESREKMAADIAFINKKIEILDQEGQDMAIKMQPEVLIK